MTLTAQSVHLPSRSATRWLPQLAVAGALAGFAGLQVAAFRIAGVFEYPLDDVYIHLAMASGMAGGTYGVNAGEAASAASSILYPVLLLPFPGTEAQRLLPLLWNLVGLCLSAGLWGVILARANLPLRLAGAMALFGPFALNMPGVAFLGMEHALHCAASLAILLGLWLFLCDGRVRPWLVAALILAPLFRLEGLALSLAAAGTIALAGQRRAGLAMMAAVVLPVIAFGAGLMALGLPPLPSSVLTKMTISAAAHGPLDRMLLQLIVNLWHPAGILLATLLVVTVAVAIGFARAPAADGHGRQGAARPALWLLAVLALAAEAHLLLGQIGWMHRYEHYIVVCLIAGLVLAAGQARGRSRSVIAGVAALSVIAAAAVWLPQLLGIYLWNPRAIHLQQAQMARFANDFAREPVAVNDLGWVAWGNPNLVLDLWGLGSERARRLRLEGTPPDGWAGMLTEERGVRLAMVYDRWIQNGIGPGWQRLGTLSMTDPKGLLGDYKVSFYATGPAAAPKLLGDLRAFVPTLPPEARFTFTPANP